LVIGCWLLLVGWWLLVGGDVTRFSPSPHLLFLPSSFFLHPFSARLGMPLRVPQLSADGFALVGGRLLPGESGPVAQFMYEDGSGKRLTLYVRADAAENRETAFRFALEGKVGVFYWLDGKLGYAISGELPREKLLNIAESAYKQLNP
jgi:anti-sigma factor RsiW